MKCHYEVLEVEKNADNDTLKKQYRKLALKVKLTIMWILYLSRIITSSIILTKIQMIQKAPKQLFK